MTMRAIEWKYVNSILEEFPTKRSYRKALRKLWEDENWELLTTSIEKLRKLSEQEVDRYLEENKENPYLTKKEEQSFIEFLLSKQGDSIQEELENELDEDEDDENLKK